VDCWGLPGKAGPRDWLVEASGDILISGLKRGKEPWSVAIRHPRRSEGYVGIVKLGSAAAGSPS